MNQIIVHTPQNEISKGYRYYNYFWDNFIEYLKSKFDIIEDTYFEHANAMSYSVKLLNYISSSLLLECEMIIENVKTKEFVVLSVSDQLTGAVLNHQHNPLCKKILFSQFDEEVIKKHLGGAINFDKFSPWIYFPSNLFNIDKIFNERKEINEFVDKFCFWGTSIEDRSILKHFNNDYFIGGLPIGTFEDYAKEITKHKVALSIAGRGEFCYRDVENFGLGTPILRFEYTNKMFNPLIPNFHYISVDRPKELIYDRLGEKQHAEMLEKRFLEIKDNKNFLDFISNNARKYYEDNLTMNNSIELTYKILNLNDWE